MTVPGHTIGRTQFEQMSSGLSLEKLTLLGEVGPVANVPLTAMGGASGSFASVKTSTLALTLTG
jgi:hypothetical protein